MNAYKQVRQALAGFGYPVATNIYTGTDEAYFVTTINALPDDFADDEPQHVVNLIMLHLHCPHTMNTAVLRKQIKTALTNAGFTYPTETDVSDELKQHIVFECQNAEVV